MSHEDVPPPLESSSNVGLSDDMPALESTGTTSSSSNASSTSNASSSVLESGLPSDVPVVATQGFNPVISPFETLDKLFAVTSDSAADDLLVDEEDIKELESKSKQNNANDLVKPAAYPKVITVHCTAWLGRRVEDTLELCRASHNVKYNAATRELRFLLRKPKCTISVYPSGKMNCLGCSSVIDSIHAMRKVARKIQKLLSRLQKFRLASLQQQMQQQQQQQPQRASSSVKEEGSQVKAEGQLVKTESKLFANPTPQNTIRLASFHVNNFLAFGSLGYRLNLIAIASSSHHADYTHYDPDLFTGLRYKLNYLPTDPIQEIFKKEATATEELEDKIAQSSASQEDSIWSDFFAYDDDADASARRNSSNSKDANAQPHISFTVHENGSITITGVKREIDVYQTYERVFQMFKPYAISPVPDSLPIPNIPNLKTMLVALASSTNQLSYTQLSDANATSTSSTSVSTSTSTSATDSTSPSSSAFELSLLPHLSTSAFPPRQQADLYGRAKRTAILNHRRMVAVQAKTFKQYDEDDKNVKPDVKPDQSTSEAVKAEQVKAESTAKIEPTSNGQTAAPEIIEIDDDNQEWE